MTSERRAQASAAGGACLPPAAWRTAIAADVRSCIDITSTPSSVKQPHGRSEALV